MAIDLSLSIGTDPLARYLRRYIGQDITITTRTGETIEGILRRVTFDGIVSILVSATVSPFTEEQVVVLRVADIVTFSFNATGL